MSEAKLFLRAWLSSYWPTRSEARDVARQYRAMMEQSPAAVADLLRRGCYFDSTIGATRDDTLINTGKRELALHLVAMTRLSPDDIRHLEERTDQNE